MGRVDVEWSVGKDPDLVVEIWSTAALTAAVIEALLEEPERMNRAIQMIRGSAPA
jgi:hypothetical protein